MRNLPIMAGLLLTSLTLGGCGEIAVKRGAGAGDLARDQALCNNQGGGQSAYEKCMKEHGWVVQKLDELSPVATVAPTPELRLIANDTKHTEPRGNSEATIAKSNDPMDLYAINSWWKAGGKPDELNPAINACVARLGEAYRPPADNRQATRGLLLCLREQGWHGLQQK